MTEWVSNGAQIGITAFFAVAVFALLCAMVAGMLMLGGRLLGGEGEHGQKRDDARRF